METTSAALDVKADVPATDAPHPEAQAKQRLLEAASHLFLEKGYAATSVNEIVESAGVAKPTLYYYFKNKEAIYLAIIQSACDNFNAVIGAHAEPQGPAFDHILALADKVYEVFMKNLNVARLIHAKSFGPPLGTPAFDMSAVESSFLGTFQSIVQRGIENGELAGDAPEIVMALGAIIDSCLMAEVNSICPIKPGREGMERSLRLLYRGIAGKGE